MRKALFQLLYELSGCRADDGLPGVEFSYETVRRWCNKIGKSYADKLSRKRPKPRDKWHLDEVFLKINGVRQYLWRAVDQHGAVIDIPVQPKAASPLSGSS